MKTLVVYDSAFGNTEQIAKSIGNALDGNVEVLHIGKIGPSTMGSFDFLFIGSPTQSGKPTKAMLDFLNNVPESVLHEKRIAAFDTRFATRFVGIFGYAAVKIADNLKSKGAVLASSPQGFYVIGKHGPLQEGELERAGIWAKATANRLSSAVT